MTDFEINSALAEEYGEILDYCNDLNAIGKIENLLTSDEYKLWLVKVAQICHKDGFGVITRSYVSATARHRAEAIFEVKNN